MLKRVKRRYLALEVDTSGGLDPKEFMDGVWSAAVELYGEYGASQTGLSLIDFSTEERFVVIRVSNAAVDMVRTTLMLMTRIGDKQVTVHVVKVSGTIKALHKNMRQHHR